MDVYINDIAVIAIIKNKKLQGFNIAIGGGLAMTFGRSDTYPRLASDIAYITPDKLLDVCSCLLYTSPSPRDLSTSRMPSSA